MTNKPSQYKKRLFFLLVMLVTIMVSGIITSRELDKQNKLIAEIANISGEQRVLSERIARNATFLLHHGAIHHKSHGDNPHTRKGALQKRIDILSLSVQKIHSNYQLLKKYYGRDEKLNVASHAFYSEKSHSNLSRYEHIHRFLSLAKNIDIYFNQKGHNVSHLITKDIIKNIHELESSSDDDLSTIFHDATEMYVDFILQKIEETRRIKNSLIVFFILFIAITIIILFFPLYKELHYFNKELETQKDKYKKEEERLNLATKGSSTGVWDWDIKDKSIHCNAVLMQIIEIDNLDKRNRFKSSYFQNLIHRLDLNKFNVALISHIRDHTPFSTTIRMRNQENDYIWVKVLGQALWDNNDHAYRMVGSIQDITKEKQEEEQKNIFIQGIEACNIAFGIIDLESPQRNFKYASPAFCALTGHSVDQLQQKNINVFTGPNTSINDLDKIDYALSEQESIELKMLSYRVEGSSFLNKVSLRPIYLNDSKIADYYIITFEDLTKSLEKEQQEITRQRNESLGSLAASVAHEINNLLMPMTMAKDVLLDELKDDCDPFAIEQLDTIEDYARQAKDIVQGVLTFSRKETSDLKKLNLYSELDNAVSFIQSLLSAKTSLIFNKPDSEDLLSIETMINSTEIKQIITNLCKNAEHAFNNKSGIIEVLYSKKHLTNNERSKHNLIAADFAIITIKDNGCGIPKNIIDKIFNPLFTTKDIGQGTGLGLSVVHGIIRSWGGVIFVKSIEGKGTEFSIYIPIHKNEDDFSDLMDLLEDK